MAGPDGLARDPEDRLIIATFAGRSAVRIEHDGRRTILPDNYHGRKFNGPNDVVIWSDGAVYFTDTFGGLRLRAKDPKVEIPYNGLYMWKDGKVSLLLKKNEMPNLDGLACRPDEKYLYVNGGADNYVNRYDVMKDDTIANGKLLFDMRSDESPGVADGMRADSAGNIYETGPGGVWERRGTNVLGAGTAATATGASAAGGALLDTRRLHRIGAFDMATQVRGCLRPFVCLEQVEDLEMLLALPREPGAVERHPVFNETAQVVDPLDRVEKELVAAAGHDGLVQLGVDAE